MASKFIAMQCLLRPFVRPFILFIRFQLKQFLLTRTLNIKLINENVIRPDKKKREADFAAHCNACEMWVCAFHRIIYVDNDGNATDVASQAHRYTAGSGAKVHFHKVA